jgi:hypothetical protein
MDSFPPVSCICLTYGRPKLLEEAIHSFLLQDYDGPKELIVLNDYEKQTLVFDHPQVRLINLPKRFQSLGEKHNAAVALCSYDLIFVWDDDNIYLPHHISFSVKKFDEAKGFFKPDRIWFWSNNKIAGTAAGDNFHSGSCWSRELFDKVGGYDWTGNRPGIEAPFEQEQPGCTKPDKIELEEIRFIYRRDVGSYHLRSLADEPQAGYEKAAAQVERQGKQGHLQLGCLRLVPHWQTDYSELVHHHRRTTPIHFGPGISKKLIRYGETDARLFLVFDDHKLAYLVSPKVACTSIKRALAKSYGIPRKKYIHNRRLWNYELGKLENNRQDYYTFAFVRNPYDRLVSCYRDKVATRRANPYFGKKVPVDSNFAQFVQTVVTTPDCLADKHFKSQYFNLYRNGEILVDYVGRFENLAEDWRVLALKFNLEPELGHYGNSKDKAGVYSDYKKYYTPELADLVYERFRDDFEFLGYEYAYRELLEFIGTQS